ncbi:MAG TPA: amino acid adenylation domain-containing protein [Mycobacteriales bacterium]|nr:amino acid adenylation domain-containing protein [Mycobacteriales bacterium]
MSAGLDVPVRAGAGPAPASAAQRRIWFVDRLHGGDAAYHVPVAVRLIGDLDVPALGRALAGVVARHEALRTVFRTVDGEPEPVVLPPPPGWDLPVRSVRDEAALQAAIAAAARRPFDLAVGPVLRAELVDAAAAGGGHVLVVTAHHVAIDGWSLGLLFTELAELYRAGVQGATPVLPDLPVQYGDVARWQAARAAAGLLAGEEDWWRAELSGAPAALELPVESRNGPRTSGEGAVARLRLDPELSDDVQELARAGGGTLYMSMLAAYELLLARYARTDQLVVGSPVAGRLRPELEPLIGCFINVLPIRAELGGEPTFRELTDRTRAAALRAFEHQELPFEAIVEAVRPDRALADTPLFQVLFSVDEATAPVVRDGGLEWHFLAVARDRVKYDLAMTVSRAGADLEVALEYRADRFGPDWAADFLGAYRTLLAAAVAEPDTPVGRLPLLTPAGRREQVEGWNDTAVPYPEVTAVELVRARVAAVPDAVAVVDGDRRFDYAELGARSAALARRLRVLGAGPGTRIGLCLHRSAELVVAILGVLEAGAAYVPLDPAYPAERLEFMLADAGVDIVLTHTAAAAAVPAAAATVLDLDRPDPAPPAAADPLPGPGLDDPAYVIYTSGSTGRPKGVVNTHRGLANRLLWMQDAFGLDGSDAVLQKTPYSFDVSVWEFLWPLATGARLVVARPDGHRDPAYLAAAMREHRVTTVHFVPSMLQVFLEAAELPAGLRRVLCSGEALPAELARRVRAAGTTAGLHNLYGPTEAAIDVSHWPCTDADGAGPVPIGRPIANTQLHVLDPYDEPVPTGVPGELVIGGVQVAAGYVNRPELTADRFRPDPFRPGGTVYRTGDLARRRRDGALEFLGRPPSSCCRPPIWRCTRQSAAAATGRSGSPSRCRRRCSRAAPPTGTRAERARGPSC